MKLTDACIRRPVFTIVLNLIIILLGICGYFYLQLRFFPIFQSQHIKISTSLAGASPSLIESAVINPIESALSNVSGIETMTSTSTRDAASIDLQLQPSADVDQVAEQVRNALSGVQDQLPTNTKAPVLQIGHNENDFMEVMFTDPTKSPAEIRDYLDHFVVNQLANVPGVADIELEGSDKYALRIQLDPAALAAHNISVNQVEQALQNANLSMPAGRVKSDNLDYPINADTNLKSVDAFKQVVITNQNNSLVRLSDIATVTMGTDSDYQELYTLDGQPGIDMSIYNTDESSPIATAKAVKIALENIQRNLPPSMKMTITWDNSVFLKYSIKEVYHTILFSILCVILAIFIFLGNWRAVFIPIATIPVCLIGSFAIMYLFGFTLNVITLLALVLSIGLVVDDAIVMLENIHRYIENGLGRVQAAFKGSRQIVFAVIGMTISLAAVYMPVGLLHGHIATIFREFAYTLAGSVLISGFVALTLSPMMCSKVLQNHSKESEFSKKIEAFLGKVSLNYQYLLAAAIKKRLWIIAITALLAISGVFFIRFLPQQFLPPEDMGYVLTVLSTPSGASFNYIQQQADLAYNAMKDNPNIQYLGTAISDEPDSFNVIFAALKPYDQRHQTAKQIAKELNNKIQKTPGLNAFVFSPSPFSGGAHQDLQFTLFSSSTYENLYQSINQLKAKLANYPGLNNINSDMDFNNQQYNITVNRDQAASMQVSVSDIDKTIADLLGGSVVTQFNQGDYSYDVILQAQDSYLQGLDNISKFYVPNANNQLVPLTNLINITPIVGQDSLPHYDRLRAADLSAQLSPGYSMGKAMRYLNEVLPKILPSDTKFAFTGTAQRLQENNSSMLIIFCLAFVFIYLILAALFESFIDPLIIILTVPICIVGALIALKFTGGSLNVYTDIGLITLIGLISKHGILITQFINECRQQGQPMLDAIMNGCRIRLRPILMTTTAMIFGALPLLFSSGAGAESRFQIGIVIISGLLVGTCFSLFVVPVAYYYLGRLKKHVGPN